MTALLLLAGCGGGEKRASGTNTTPAAAVPTNPAPTTTSRTDTSPSTTTQPSSTSNGGTSAPGETQPGGPGDEQPAVSEVNFVGNGGKITPTSVRVAPFIQIKVSLKSKDNAHYGIVVAGRQVNAGLGRGDGSVTIPGLRQQKSYIVTVTAGSPDKLKITGSSEPGP